MDGARHLIFEYLNRTKVSAQLFKFFCKNEINLFLDFRVKSLRIAHIEFQICLHEMVSLFNFFIHSNSALQLSQENKILKNSRFIERQFTWYTFSCFLKVYSSEMAERDRNFEISHFPTSTMSLLGKQSIPVYSMLSNCWGKKFKGLAEDFCDNRPRTNSTGLAFNRKAKNTLNKSRDILALICGNE